MVDGSPPWNGSASVGAGPAPEERAQYACPPLPVCRCGEGDSITAGAALSERSLVGSAVPLAPRSLKLQGH